MKTTDAQRAATRRWTENNRERTLAKQAEWRKAHVERVREIQRKSDRKIYEARREEILAAAKAFRAAAPLGYHITNAKMRARRFGLPFAITVEDVMVPPACPICERAFEFGEGRTKPRSISLDRLLPERGYTPENTWVVCLECNQSKNAASPGLLARVLVEMMQRGLWHPTPDFLSVIRQFDAQQAA